MPSICLESCIVNGKTRFIFQMNVYTLWGYVCYLPRTEMASWFTSRNSCISTRTTQYISLALFTQTDLDHPMGWLTLTMPDSFYVLHSHSSPSLAHLSRRLTDELLVYQCLQCLSDICQHFSNIFGKHWANSTQISYGDSIRWGSKSLYKCSWSHDQDGHHIRLKKY